MKNKSWLLSICVPFLLILSACGSGANTASSPAASTAPSATANYSSAPAATQAAASKDPIVIGFNNAMTGPVGKFGADSKQGMEIRLEEVNAKGGVLGRQVKVVYYDDKNDPEQTVKNAQQLMKQDGAKIIIGPTFSANAKAIQPIADQNKVIMYSISGAYVPPADSYVFAGITYTAKSIHEYMHQWLIKKGIKKVGLLATDEVSGDVSTDIIKALNGKDGIQYVVERMGVKDTDATPQITKLKNQGIEALEIVGTAIPSGVAVKSATQLGMNIPYLFTNGNLTSAFGQLIKDSVKPGQALFVGPPIFAYKEMSSDNPLKPITANLAKKVEDKYKVVPEAGHGFGYDHLSIILKAIETAGTDDPVKVKEALETKIGDFQASNCIVRLTKQDHIGTTTDGAVMVKMDPSDVSFHMEWENTWWKK